MARLFSVFCFLDRDSWLHSIIYTHEILTGRLSTVLLQNYGAVWRILQKAVCQITRAGEYHWAGVRWSARRVGHSVLWCCGPLSIGKGIMSEGYLRSSWIWCECLALSPQGWVEFASLICIFLMQIKVKRGRLASEVAYWQVSRHSLHYTPLAGSFQPYWTPPNNPRGLS